ncbi:hypothetical protein HK405_011869, partial [Cladochytrium tenue]
MLVLLSLMLLATPATLLGPFVADALPAPPAAAALAGPYGGIGGALISGGSPWERYSDDDSDYEYQSPYRQESSNNNRYGYSSDSSSSNRFYPSRSPSPPAAAPAYATRPDVGRGESTIAMGPPPDYVNSSNRQRPSMSSSRLRHGDDRDRGS